VKAVGVVDFGGPEVLRVLDLPVPPVGVGTVRIRVRAATVNPTDTMLRAGGRAAMLVGREPPYIPGMEVAGVIDAVGDGVTRFQPGAQVMAVVMPNRPGAYAEQVVVPAESVAVQPQGVGDAPSATLPMNGLTAARALKLLQLSAGAWLGVTGAAGTVGGYLVELAKIAGLRVIADASAKDDQLVRAFGADVVVPRGDDFASRVRAVVPEGVDAVADAAIMNELTIPAIRDGGALAVFRRWAGETGRAIALHQVSVGDCVTDFETLECLCRYVEEGRLTLRVAEVLPAEEAARAHRLLQAGGVRGRIVLAF
jgi:NADPH:quinone reductase